ncbi:hypothetical protein D3C87_1604000 [compost metagenome]
MAEVVEHGAQHQLDNHDLFFIRQGIGGIVFLDVPDSLGDMPHAFHVFVVVVRRHRVWVVLLEIRDDLFQQCVKHVLLLGKRLSEFDDRRDTPLAFAALKIKTTSYLFQLRFKPALTRIAIQQTINHPLIPLLVLLQIVEGVVLEDHCLQLCILSWG